MNNSRRKLLGGFAGSVLAPMLPLGAHAQEFQPTRLVKIIVPYNPGGVPDVMARQIAIQLSALWKQSVIVENRPGAAGALGADVVAKSPGDGLTFLIADDGALVSAPLLKAKLAYDPQKDIVPLGTVGASPFVILGSANSVTFKQLIDKAKAAPDSVDYASNGIGGPHHLAWERWQEQLGIKLTQVPYNGTVAALQDVAAGRVAMMVATPSSALALLQAGKLKALAAVSSRRFPFMPNIPTTAELGYPALQGDAWYGFMAPGSMPLELRERVAADLRSVLRSSAYLASLTDRHNLPLVLNARETADRMSAQRTEAMALFKRVGIEPT